MKASLTNVKKELKDVKSELERGKTAFAASQARANHAEWMLEQLKTTLKDNQLLVESLKGSLSDKESELIGVRDHFSEELTRIGREVMRLRSAYLGSANDDPGNTGPSHPVDDAPSSPVAC